MIGIALISVVVLYIPLSYLLPGFVDFMLSIELNIFVYDGSFSSALSTAINIITVVVLAPIVEEVIFRWLLIERWKAKYSATTAVLMSSSIFGFLHADILGGVIFGVILSAIYLYTKSLWGPILIHIGNNALAVGFLMFEWDASLSSREDLYAYWPMMVLIGSCFVLPWLLFALLKGYQNKFRLVFSEA